MKVELECPLGEYRSGRIWCKAVDGMCGNQRFKPCKGWCVLTEGAKKCPKRGNSKPK